jgi:hypothetical protein
MNFLHPEILWALPAAAAPWLIHLFSRRSAKPVLFSDLTLLSAVEASARPRARLRDLLLLALRCALIAAVIIAAAGPASPGGAAGGESIDLVLLLDASYSMRAKDAGRTRFDAAREAGRGLLRRLGPGDRVAFSVFDTSVRSPLQWTDARPAQEAMARSEAGLQGTDAGSALVAAREILAKSSAGRRRAVVLLGDGAAHMIRASPPPPAEGCVVFGLKFPSLPNAWIADVRAVPTNEGREPRLETRLGASGNSTPSEVDLWVGERRGVSAPAVTTGRGEARAILPLPREENPSAPEWSGKASTRPDALPEDDERFFTVRLPPSPRALVLYGDPSFDRAGRAGWTLRALFGGGEKNLADREADFLASSRWTEADLGRYGTVILPDAAVPPPGLSSALEKFAAQGGGVWVIPGSGAATSDLGALSSWLPARFGAPVSGTPNAGLRVTSAAEQSRDWDRYALDQVAFRKIFRLEAGPSANVRLTDAAGAPLLVDGPVGRGRAVVWAVPIDLAWSNLNLKPLFVAWARLCLSLTTPASDDAAPGAFVGDALVKTWRADEAAPDRVAVRGPGGLRTSLAVRERRAQLPSAPRPGLYEMIEPSGRPTIFAVNVDVSRGESDLTPATSPPWRESSAQALETDFFAEIHGRRREGFFLGLAAVLLAGEMLASLSAVPAAGALLLFGLLTPSAARAQQGDRFVWTQLQLGSSWDPYPDAPERATALLQETTSAKVTLKRRVLTLDDPLLFSSPFIYLAGSEAPAELSEEQRRRLRQYLTAGGFLWIEDSTGGPRGSFDAWVRRLLPSLLLEAELRPLPADHVIGRTFFLLRGPAGRVRVQGALEGASWNGKLSLLYTRDDVLGAWSIDALGRPLRACAPGGESQREAARRETLNILMYTMTGSYKADAVHQAAILDKLRGLAP